jgi:hypothetical protein
MSKSVTDVLAGDQDGASVVSETSLTSASYG